MGYKGKEFTSRIHRLLSGYIDYIEVIVWNKSLPCPTRLQKSAARIPSPFCAGKCDFIKDGTAFWWRSPFKDFPPTIRVSSDFTSTTEAVAREPTFLTQAAITTQPSNRIPSIQGIFRP